MTTELKPCEDCGCPVEVEFEPATNGLGPLCGECLSNRQQEATADQRYDMLGRPTKWPTDIECGQDGCKELAWITDDQGAGYVGYECPTHGSFAVQYDDSDDDMYDPDMDFGDWDEDEYEEEYY